MTERPKVAIYGGGPAAMMAALTLAPHTEVAIYEKGKMLGRKFLVAGKGGFNLSHHVRGKALYQKYTPATFLQPCLSVFDSAATQRWLKDLGIPTFVGSSGRIFPERGIKPVQVLRAIEQRMSERSVRIYLQHTFVGFEEGQPLVQHQEKTFTPQADYHIFALGGASWAKTGSDGGWLPYFEQLGVACRPFQPANCGIEIDWSADFIQRFAGTPLKNIQLSLGAYHIKGEAVVTQYGLEGNAIYPLASKVRTALEKGAVHIILDSKPQMNEAALLKRMAGRDVPTRQYASVFKVQKAILGIIKQCSSKAAYMPARRFISLLKSCPIPVRGLRPIEEAISTIGGISLGAIDPHFQLKTQPNIYCIGEMLDWDAPTGGFLLQGCFSMGYFVAKGILAQSCIKR